jgi:hypothetical protein
MAVEEMGTMSGTKVDGCGAAGSSEFDQTQILGDFGKILGRFRERLFLWKVKMHITSQKEY